jgi:hypothetical protein
MIAAMVVFWMMFTSRPTSGGRSRRSACGRITKLCRPTQPKPRADAASCCSRGIESIAPRVVSATWALPHRTRPIAAALYGVQLAGGMWNRSGTTNSIRKIVTISGSPRQTSMYARMSVREGQKRIV